VGALFVEVYIIASKADGNSVYNGDPELAENSERIVNSFNDYYSPELVWVTSR
jgi:hypothetical protein